MDYEVGVSITEIKRSLKVIEERKDLIIDEDIELEKIVERLNEILKKIHRR